MLTSFVGAYNFKNDHHENPCIRKEVIENEKEFIFDYYDAGWSPNEIDSADIVVLNYDSVQVTGDIETYTAHRDGDTLNSGVAGNITITNIVGNIIIGGTVDAHKDHADYGEKGIVNLEAGGSITIGSLDLDNVQYAMLKPGGDAFIEGALDNFDTASPSGGGTKGSPYDTDEGGLRAPADTVVYYEYVKGGLNDSLGGHVWQL